MPQRITLSLIIIFLFQLTIAQLRDDFTDGDFSSGPVWAGMTEKFQVNDEGRLQLFDDAAGESFLSTGSTLIDKTVWEFYLEMHFNPSSANYAKVYLLSDQADLSGALNGYFVMIGDTDDEISLYRQEGTATVKIVDGTDDLLDNSSVAVRVKVIRNESGQWDLLRDEAGGTDFVSEGSVTDGSLFSGNYFGIYCQYTSTRSDKFFFDDFVVQQVEINDVNVISSTTFDVQFNQDVSQLDAENVANYGLAGLIISSVEQLSTTTIKVLLDPDTPLMSDSYTLTVSADLTKNSPISIQFEYLELKLESLLTLSETEVQLTFNDHLDPVSAEDVDNYVIDNGIGRPNTAALDPEGQSIVVLTLNNPLFENAEFQLDLTAIENEAQNSTLTTSGNFHFVVPLVLDTAFAVTKKEVLVRFNKMLGEITAEEVSNFTINPLGDLIAATLQEDNLSIVLNLTAGLESGLYTLDVSNLQDSDGNEIDPTGGFAAFEYLQLAVDRIDQVNEASLFLKFNQPLEETTAETLTNYELSEVGDPLSATYQKTDSAVILQFARLYNTRHTLSVRDVINHYGNATIDQESSLHEVSVEVPSEFRSIILNELLPDPVPVIGLPDAEYVELYNPSAHSIDLHKFQLNGATLPSAIIKPGDYVLVTSTSNSAQFSMDNVLGISGFDVLTNSGESVVLKDQFGTTIDSLHYDLSWYRDTQKDDGGYALELIDPLHPCSGKTNWIASLHETGGTPGYQNSVFSDEADKGPPGLEHVEVVGGDTLYLSFSEPIDEASMSEASFSLPGHEFTGLIPLSYSEYFLMLDQALKSELTYELTLGAISDCFGNILQNQVFSFYYDTKPPAFERIVVLSDTEIGLVFNEPLSKSKAENEDNYHKIHSLVTPQRAILQDSALHRVHLAFETAFENGQTYSIKYSGLADTLENKTEGGTTAFDFQNEIDTAFVVAPNLLEIAFSKTPQEAMAKNPKHYFFPDGGERPEQVIADSNDPNLFRLAFNSNFPEDTEFYIYVEGLADHQGEPLITPAYPVYYDTQEPSVTSLMVRNDTQVVVSFDEKVDLRVATATNLYELENGKHPVRIEVVTASELELTFKEKFEVEIEKRLSLGGIIDLVGNAMRTRRHLSFIYDPRPPDILWVKHRNDTTIEFAISEIAEKTSLLEKSNYRLDGQNPYAVRPLGPDSLLIFLHFSTISTSASSALTVGGVADKKGNMMEDSVYLFNTKDPRISGVHMLNDTILQVGFSKRMSRAASAVESYGLSGFKITKVSAATDFSYLLEISTAIPDGDSLILVVNNLTDQEGNALTENIFRTKSETYLKSISVKNPKTIEITFDTRFSSISDSFFQVDGNLAVHAVLDESKKNSIFLSLERGLEENVRHEVRWYGLKDVYERNLPGYFKSISLDTKPPELSSISSDFFGTLALTFSERVKTDIAASADRYQLSGLGHPLSVAFLLDSVLVLDYEDQLNSSQDYLLVVEGIPDFSGNFSESDTIVFTYDPPGLPSYQEIIINEIMADPSPSAGLAEEEYVELYNNSEKTFNLKGIKLGDVSKTLTLPDYLLHPYEYVVVASPANLDVAEWPNFLGVAGLPALGNNGDSIFVTTIYDELIDAASYTPIWYRDNEKSQGGYSLELINPFSACPGSVNWTASRNRSGGTPGAVNSVYHTGPDGVVPEVLSTEIIDHQTIRITFNESMDTASMSSAAIELADFEMKRAISGEFYDEFTLSLTSGALEPGRVYKLSISGATDCTGTEMEALVQEIGIGKIPEPGDLIITEIMADPEPPVGLPNSEYLELYNNSGGLLSVKNLKLIDATDTTFLPDVNIPADAYLVLCPATRIDEFRQFGYAVGLSKWLSLNNTGESLILAGLQMIDKVDYSRDWYGDTDKADGGFSLELINPFSACPGSVNWTASRNRSGGTPGTENTVFSRDPDNIPPEILLYEAVDEQTVRITFNESMDSLSLVDLVIKANHITVWQRAVGGTENEVLTLILTEEIQRGEVYQMEISGALDCTGNPMQPTGISFGIGAKPGFNDLLITEIMADPEPSAGLPLSEYLEVYNATDKLLALEGLILSDGGGSTIFPAMSLKAHEYLVFLPNSSVSLFETSNKAGLSNWLTLANAGEELLISDGENFIFQMVYAADWHDSDEEAEGGYSLEMKDLANPCTGKINWGSSISAKGGTPGYDNSNVESIPDNFGPRLLEVYTLSADSLRLVFDEILPPEIASSAVCSITPEVSVHSIYQPPHQRDELILKMSEVIRPNELYSLKIEGVTDCNGNPGRSNSAAFVLPGTPDSLDLVLNEILFNPRSGGVDFVEVYNRSVKYLNLSHWQIARENIGELDARVVTESSLILEPHHYLAFTEDTLMLKSHYPGGIQRSLFQVAQLPVFPNEEGTVVLLSPDGFVSDRFSYEDDYHQTFLQSADGVSLERISVESATQDPHNWQSASAVAGFATPGYVNSQSFEAPKISGTVKVEPKVFVPNSANPAHKSFTTINYQLDKGGQFANVVIYNQLGQPVAELEKGSSLSTSGFIRWDGTDASGNIVRMGYYVVLFEIYDSNGNQQVLKETVVVGR